MARKASEDRVPVLEAFFLVEGAILYRASRMRHGNVPRNQPPATIDLAIFTRHTIEFGRLQNDCYKLILLGYDGYSCRAPVIEETTVGCLHEGANVTMIRLAEAVGAMKKIVLFQGLAKRHGFFLFGFR